MHHGKYKSGTYKAKMEKNNNFLAGSVKPYTV